MTNSHSNYSLFFMKPLSCASSFNVVRLQDKPTVSSGGPAVASSVELGKRKIANTKASSLSAADATASSDAVTSAANAGKAGSTSHTDSRFNRKTRAKAAQKLRAQNNKTPTAALRKRAAAGNSRKYQSFYNLSADINAQTMAAAEAEGGIASAVDSVSLFAKTSTESLLNDNTITTDISSSSSGDEVVFESSPALSARSPRQLDSRSSRNEWTKPPPSACESVSK